MTILSSLLIAISFLQFFEDRNTMANFVLVPPLEGEEVTIVRPDLSVVEKCPACKGAGKLKLEEPNYGQANGRLGSGRRITKECPICKGGGRLDSFLDPATLQTQIAKDREEFASKHQGKGEIAVGEAFVPNEVYREAKRKDLKLVEQAYGAPCKKCMWTGLALCSACKGQGIMPCPSKDCKNGWDVTEKTTSYTRTSSGGGTIGGTHNSGFRRSNSRRTTRKETKITVTLCTICGGAAHVKCPTCGGRRYNVCPTCKGTGLKRGAR